MKKYMFKRIIAGAMALVTVAAYTPLVDFSALPQSTAIVASAREDALGSSSLNATSWESGDYFEDDATFNVEAGSSIDINLSNLVNGGVPKDDSGVGNFHTATLVDGEWVENEGNPTGFDENVVTGVQSVKYVKATKGENGGKLFITYKNGATSSCVVLTLEEGSYLSVSNVVSTPKEKRATYTLNASELKEAYTLDFNAIAPYVSYFEYTGKNGKKYTLTDNAVAYGSYYAKAKTDVTLTTKAVLENMEDYLDEELTDRTAGTYTYKFKALRDMSDEVLVCEFNGIKIKKENNTVEFPDDFKASIKTIHYEEVVGKDYEVVAADVTPDGEIILNDGDNNPAIAKGEMITFTSTKSFRINTGKKKDGDPVYTYGTYSDGKYTAVFPNLVDEGADNTFANVEIEFVNHKHKLKYTLNNNYLLAECTADEHDLKDVEAASVATYVPTDKADTYEAVKTNSQIQYKEYDATNDPNGTTAFEEKIPELRFNIADDLLGEANDQTGTKYVATITYGNKKTTGQYTFTYKINKNANNDSDNEYTVTKTLNNKTTDVTEDFFGTADKPIATYKPTLIGESFKNGIKFAPNLFFTEQGEYTANLEVYDSDDNTGKMILAYKYTVVPSDVLNENNMKLTAGYYNGTDDIVYTLPVSKNADGVYEVQVNEDKLKQHGNVWLQVKFIDKKTKKEFNQSDNGVTYFKLNGTEKGDNLDEEYLVNVNVVHPSYANNTIPVKWKLVKEKENDDLYFEYQVGSDGNVETINTKSSSDSNNPMKVKFDAVEEQLRAALRSGDETLDLSKATFQYSEVPFDEDGDIPLDSLIDGLPNVEEDEVDKDKVYYVYAYVDSVTTMYPVPVVLSKTAQIPVHAKLNKLTYAYGERITLDDLSFLTADGTEVTFDEDEFLPNGAKGDKKVNNTKITFKPIDNTGKVSDTAVTLVDEKVNEGDVCFLEPGKYEVTFGAGSVGNNDSSGLIALDTNGKTTKAYVYAADTSGTDNDPVKYIIEVKKRTIDPTMFGDHIAELGDGTTDVRVTNTTYNGLITLPDKDMEDLEVTVSGGTTSATATGTYQVKLKPTGNATKYYQGTASVNWYVTTTTGNETLKGVNLVWNESALNIYRGTDGGIQVHVEAFQADSAKLTALLDNEAQLDEDEKSYIAGGEYCKGGIYAGDDYVNAARATTAANTTAYGFVYDKKKTFAKDADPAEVAKSLKLDAKGEFNGQKATNATIKDIRDKNGVPTSKSGCVTGVNFSVGSVDDYYWVVPYVTVEGGAPVYGQPIMLDFQKVAQDVLQPEVESIDLVQKDIGNGNLGLYYYVYATKYTRKDGNDRTIQPERWGVTLDRTGNYGYNPGLDDFDYDALTLDNCDAHSEALKNSTKYTEDEVGTLISIKDSLSRVYVKTYIDFGNDFVVYTTVDDEDAKWTAGGYTGQYYAESASSTLGKYMGLATIPELEGAGNTQKARMAAVRFKGFNLAGYLTAFERYTQDAGTRPKWTDYFTEDARVVVVPARETLNTKANAQQVFEPIIIDNSEEADAENKLTEFGEIYDTTGAAYNVWEDMKLTDNRQTPADFFTLSSGYKVRKAVDVNKSNVTSDEITFGSGDDATTFSKNDYTIYTLNLNAPKYEDSPKYTARAYAKYKGLDIYGNVISIGHDSPKELSPITDIYYSYKN